jgi:Holliday junction resolvase RusA-like endonuclease
MDKVTQQPTIVLHLPIPPSINKLWANSPGKPRVRSSAYRAWIIEAGWEARTQLVGVPTIAGTFDALISVPVSSRRDRDSWSKSLFDLCQHVGAIRNDSGLRSYSVIGDDRTDCMVALWDTGGPEQRAPKIFRMSAKPRSSQPTLSQITRAEAARRLPR